jgi:hypothetical protein
MSPQFRRKLASIITTLIMGYILYRVIDRLFIVMWVQVPWWGLILLLVLLFFAIDYMVNRILKAD